MNSRSSYPTCASPAKRLSTSRSWSIPTPSLTDASPIFAATGFLSRSLIVPRFVLDELQLLADSHEPAKRERGRRGLEILNQLQGSREVKLTVHDGTSEDVDLGADARLVQIAKVLKARLLTNDY